jgi:hypothetical protein
MTEIEIEMMLPQAKENLEPPEAGRSKKAFSPRPSGRSMALSTSSFWTS